MKGGSFANLSCLSIDLGRYGEMSQKRAALAVLGNIPSIETLDLGGPVSLHDVRCNLRGLTRLRVLVVDLVDLEGAHAPAGTPDEDGQAMLQRAELEGARSFQELLERRYPEVLEDHSFDYLPFDDEDFSCDSWCGEVGFMADLFLIHNEVERTATILPSLRLVVCSHSCYSAAHVISPGDLQGTSGFRVLPVRVSRETDGLCSFMDNIFQVWFKMFKPTSWKAFRVYIKSYGC
jgi:hypothetical protein